MHVIVNRGRKQAKKISSLTLSSGYFCILSKALFSDCDLNYDRLIAHSVQNRIFDMLADGRTLGYERTYMVESIQNFISRARETVSL